MAMSETAFEVEFGGRLRGSARFEPFKFICDKLDGIGAPLVIVETGCMRQLNNWHGDGQSTLVWDWLITRNGGMLTSVDIDENACAMVIRATKNAHARRGNSVEVLPSLPYVSHIDLLYLDSMDWTGDRESAIHHLNELASVWDRLKEGCVIAVDDCFEPTRGKGQEIYRVLTAAGMTPMLTGHVTVWQKPDGASSWEEMTDAQA
jgi:hypothetical protein